MKDAWNILFGLSPEIFIRHRTLPFLLLYPLTVHQVWCLRFQAKAVQRLPLFGTLATMCLISCTCVSHSWDGLEALGVAWAGTRIWQCTESGGGYGAAIICM